MNRKRLLFLMATFALVASSLASGTFGLGMTQVDRGFTGTVADDESAYIGLDQTTTAENNTANVTLTISNNYPDTTVTEVAVYADDEQHESSTESLNPGDQTTLHVENTTCGADLRIEVTGSESHSTLWRSVDCP